MRYEKSYRMVGTELSIEYSAYEWQWTASSNLRKAISSVVTHSWPAERGIDNMLVTLVVAGVEDADALGNNALFKDGEARRATGGNFGFRMNESLALGMVKPELAEVGTEIEIEILGKNYPQPLCRKSVRSEAGEAQRCQRRQRLAGAASVVLCASRCTDRCARSSIAIASNASAPAVITLRRRPAQCPT